MEKSLSGGTTPVLYHKNKIWKALNVPFLWESPVPSQVPFYIPWLKWFTGTCLPRWCHQGSCTWSWISARSGRSTPTYCQGVWCEFSPRGYVKPKIPSTTLFEEYGHLHTGRQATEWRFVGRKGALSWWMKGIFSSGGSWFPCNQMATGSRPNFASWPCSSVMITTDWTRSLVNVRILNTTEWFLKIIRLVQHPGQHLTTELMQKWEAKINSFKSQVPVKSPLQEWDTKPLKVGQDRDAGAHLTYKEIEICTKSELRTGSWFYKRAFYQ